jgi:hypothetical protein
MAHALPVRDEFVVIYGACAHCGHRLSTRMNHIFLDVPTVAIRCRLAYDDLYVPPNFVESPEKCARVLAMLSKEGEDEDETFPL